MLYFNLAVHEPDPLTRINHRERALKLEIEEYGLIHSATARTIIAIALARIQLKEFPEAKTLLDKGYAILKSLDSVDSEIMEYYAFDHKENNEIEKAISYYQEAIELEVKANGGKSRRHSNIMENLAGIYFDLNDYDKCLLIYNELIESISHEYYGLTYYYEKLFHYNWGIGRIYYVQENYVVAKNKYLIAINIHQENPTEYSAKHILNLKYRQALCCYYSNEYNECIEIISKIISSSIEDLSLKKKHSIYKLIGDACFFSEAYLNSIHYYQQALPLVGESGKKVEIIELIAACFQKTHQLDKALNHYHQCIELSAFIDETIDVSRFYYFIGKIHRQRKNIIEAINQFQKGQSISPKWYFSYQIAGCLEEMSDLANALKLYIEVAEMLKDDPEAGLNDKDTLKSIQHAKRLAKELGNEGDLPQWITEINL